MSEGETNEAARRRWDISRLSLRAKVTLLLLALSLGPLLIAGMVNVNRAVEQGKKAERAHLSKVASYAAREVQTLLTRSHRAMANLAHLFPVEDFDFDGTKVHLRSGGTLLTGVPEWEETAHFTELDSQFSAVFATLRDGSVFWAHPFRNVSSPPNVRAHGWFSSPPTIGGVALGRFLPFTGRERPALIALAPIRDRERNLMGFVGGIVAEAAVQRIVEDAQHRSLGQRLVVLDPEGVIAASPKGEETGTRAPRELSMSSGTGEVDLGDVEWVVASADAGRGWSVKLLTPADLAYRPVYGLIWMLTVVIVLTFLFVLLFAEYLANVLLHPIRQLERGAQMFANGMLDYRIELDQHPNDELGRLARTFNDMGDSLQKGRRQIGAYSRSLETANEELDAMVFAITHDLRKALRGIEAFATFLEEDYTEHFDDDGEDLLEGIHTNVDRITALCDDLVGLVEHQRERGEVSRFEMSVLLTEARSTVLERRGKGQIVLQEGLPGISAERNSLSLAFVNLLDNGLKFNRSPEPVVVVRWSDQGLFWRFEVGDNGIGIDPRYHDTVFELFHRLNQVDEFPGSGTGLNLVKRIIEEHRGTIAVDSALGEGSKFIITLPKDAMMLTMPGIAL